MLKLLNISKTYKTGELVQVALDGVSLNLRDNEFVAILGPSGSGKTTLLNIIGGLDRYDDGDLIINNVSTKNYKDRDWDTYRNHTIGFVFQSYNLIPHQSVLSNVELALTIAGISRKERRQRALDALEQVGLKDQAHKKPNQMSGGQMQRVAIARALVNNPDILLADEPTGALDSKTSIQVMELLKKVAKERLVVMVTHNPELANKYANRIVNLKDGKIIADSNPYNPIDEPLLEKAPKVKKAHMSFLTALSLSFNNLLTKKGRTILTALAGSIGIIGIALILSLSTGFQNYIDKIQEDALSSYPLTITSETADATSLILSMVSDRKENPGKENIVRERQYLATMFSSIGSNDLKSLKTYLDNHYDEYKDNVTYINYTYSINPNIFTYDAAGNLAKINPSSLWSTLYSNSASSFMSSFSMGGSSIFNEMNENMQSYIDQYDLLAGKWPEKYDEMIIVLSEPNSISDLLLYSLGLRDNSELRSIINTVMANQEVDIKHDSLEFTYQDLMNTDLRLIKATDIYKYNVKYNIYEDMSNDDEYMAKLYDNALKLKIVGIVCAKDNDSTAALATGVAYTKDLTKYIIEQASKTSIVSKQLANKDIDVFSSNSFEEENKNNDELDFNDMISVDEEKIKDAFKFDFNEEDFDFDMISSSEMEKIVMKSATATAQAINQGPDKTQLIAMFAFLNSSILDNYINQYEQIKDIIEIQTIIQEEEEITIKYLLINDDYIETIKEEITGETYEKILLGILDNLPEDITVPQEMKQMLKVLFTDQDYDSLAEDIKKMYDAYFNSLKALPSYQNNKILYDDSVENNITYGVPPVPRSLLIGGVLVDEENLANTTQVINKIMNQYVVGMIAGGIGTATAQMMEPIAESLSKLGDMFNEDMFKFDSNKFASAFNFEMSKEELSRLMETMMSDSNEKSYSKNLLTLGYQDIDDPSAISFYFKDFDGKEKFLEFLDKYNDTLQEEKQIKYTDITGILMSSVKTIVDVVTYVLIAFVSISLVVSSIMIAIITLISVMERTKEIGILRAMGASKRNVSSIFNAETFIIGLLSGALGVGVTLLLIPVINKIIHTVTGNYDVNAVLPKQGAIALVIIAVILTIIAGFIPSKKAAKQDPVVALRTE